MVGACTSAENRTDLETKSLLVHRLRQLRRWSGLVLDGSENAVNGEKEDKQDETVMCSGELQCKQSLILCKEAAESWKHQGAW